MTVHLFSSGLAVKRGSGLAEGGPVFRGPVFRLFVEPGNLVERGREALQMEIWRHLER